jgi:hypothetical protein
MKKKFLLALSLFAAISLNAPMLSAAETGDKTLPSGVDLIKRAMERSAAQAKATNAPAWAYDKRQVMEKLDGDGKVKERTVKLYRVHIVQGVPISQLVKVEGQNLTEAELKEEHQHDMAFEKEFSGRDPKKVVKQREALIPKEVLDNFEFKSLRREPIQGRQTVEVSFNGKSDKDEGSIPERLMSRLAGTLWVDETTSDMARMKVHLTKSLSIGVLGVVGAIKDCKMELVSKPMPDGAWLPENTKMSFSARIFLSNVRIQIEETSSNFVLEPAGKAPQP